MKKWKAGRHLIHFGGNFAELFFSGMNKRWADKEYLSDCLRM